jgi:hypothetical protein
MIPLEYCNKLLQCGLSLLVSDKNKKPIHSWHELQNKPATKEQFEKYYNLPDAGNIGILTGYNNIEVIDIDLKIIPGLQEQQAFWNELRSFIADNIDDFDNKFVIYKTINNGYHIIYKCEEIAGNQKLAKLKGQKEAILETRGKGGYVVVYDKKISRNDYTNIQEISILDREVLISICKTYNYTGPEIETEPLKEEKHHKEYNEAKITPWNDFNAKNNIFDIVSSEFNIVRKLSDKYIIKRHGAKSPHSGYIYKNSNCMYLFTTGTIYPNEKLISPFIAYAIKNHGGNCKAAASKLYKDGYGSRVIKESKISKKESYNIKDELTAFPIDIFPKDIQFFLIECSKKMNMNIDYQACSLLWLMSVIIGNAIKIKIRNGWEEKPILWMVLIGNTGVGKTPAIKNIIKPLLAKNIKEIRNFIKLNEKFEAFMNLTKEEKAFAEEIEKPQKKQFIVNEITQEALFELHEEVKNSIGVYKDELAGWINEMNKYRAGGDLEFWLSSWSATSVYQNRKTAKSSFIQNPFIPVLGGIQPTIFKSFCSEEKEDSGFIDRMLICYPDIQVEKYNENEVSDQLLEYYHEQIIRIFDEIQESIKTDEDGEIVSYTATFTPSAKKLWVQYFDEITEIQNSENENEKLKSMYPKMKTYMARLALIINTLYAYEGNNNSLTDISEKSIKAAKKLIDYFINNAKKVKLDITNTKDLKVIIETNKGKNNNELIKVFFENDPDFNKSIAAQLLGISRQQIYRIIKDLK